MKLQGRGKEAMEAMLVLGLQEGVHQPGRRPEAHVASLTTSRQVHGAGQSLVEFSGRIDAGEFLLKRLKVTDNQSIKEGDRRLKQMYAALRARCG